MIILYGLAALGVYLIVYGSWLELIDRLKKEVISECIDFQKTVSQFPTAKDCATYNLALRDFANFLGNKK